MASRFGSKRFAIGAGVVVALVAALVWLTRDPGPQRDSRGRPLVAHGKSSGRVSRWLPWMNTAPKGDPDQIPDPYKGPRVPVRVKVVDMEGNPVRGVMVEARVDPDEWEYAGLSEEEYDAYIETKYAVEDVEVEEEDTEEALSAEGEFESEEDWRVLRAAVDSGRTGRDGVYTAQIKPDLDVVFHAKDGDGREGVSPLLYVYLPDEEESEDAVPDDLDPYRRGDRFEVTIELAELGILAGVVVDDRGHPIEGAEVSLSPWGGDLDSDDLIASETARDQRTKEDGSFRIPLRASGAFDVEVHAPKFQPVVEQAVQVLPGRETALNITMLASAEIAGVVLDPRGMPVEGARVLVQGQPSPHEYVSSETNTDADGHFVIEGLAPGRYTVAALADGFRPAEQWDVAAGQGEMTIRLTAGGKIHGDVVAQRDLQPRSRGVMGEMNLPPDENSETPGQLFFGDVYVSHHGPPQDPGQPIPVGVALATGVPQGREIESPSGTLDVRGRYFTQLPLDEAGRGTFDVEGLPPGTYDVTVMIGAAVARRTQIRVWDGGTANVSMELPDRGAASIAGTIRSSDGRPLREATIFLYGALPSGLSAWADASGRFEFRSVPAGEYMLHAAATVPSKEDPGSLVTAYVATEVVKVPASGRVPVDLLATPSDIPPDPDTLVIDLSAIALDGEMPDTTEYTFEDMHEDPYEEEEEIWMPDVWIEDIDTGLVVTYAPPAPNGTRLFGGDRVTSIDGASVTAMESWEALELLYGPKGSLCRITVERPASRETISVSLPRDKDAYEMEGHIY